DGTVQSAGKDAAGRNGVLNLDGLVPGRWAVRVVVGEQNVWLGVHDLLPQTETDLGIHRLEAHGSVLLQVRDVHGQPVTTELMMMTPGDFAAVETLVVRNGTCRSRPCCPGRYRVQAWLPRWPLISREVEVRAGEETVLAIEIPASVERQVVFSPVPHREA